jgi:hypothetical protein
METSVRDERQRTNGPPLGLHREWLDSFSFSLLFGNSPLSFFSPPFQFVSLLLLLLLSDCCCCCSCWPVSAERWFVVGSWVTWPTWWWYYIVLTSM